MLTILFWLFIGLIPWLNSEIVTGILFFGLPLLILWWALHKIIQGH